MSSASRQSPKRASRSPRNVVLFRQTLQRQIGLRHRASRERPRERRDVVGDEGVGLAEQIAMLAADRAPDQGAVARVRIPRPRRSVSITSGPERPSRPSSLITMASHRRATMPMPPKQPNWPPSSTRPARPRCANQHGRMISETPISPALASCSRTPPDSTSSSTAAGFCRAPVRAGRPAWRHEPRPRRRP